MKKSISILSIIAVLSLVASPVFADKSMHGGHSMKGKRHHGYSGHMGGSKHGGKGCHARHNVLRHQEEIGLKEEQVSKIKSLKTEKKKRAIRLQADIDVAEIELRELLHIEGVSMESVESKVREIEAKSADIRIDRYRTRIEVMSILTPEQRKQVKKIFRKSMKK